MAANLRSIVAPMLLGLTLLTAPGAAFATPSFELLLTDGNLLSAFNLTSWSLRNTSTAGEEITSFSITIGDTGYEFDYIRDASSAFPFYTIAPGVTGVSVLTGNGFDGGQGFDQIDLAFSDFQAGEQFDFQLDIDTDGFFGNPITDARQVLFNNGALTSNATLLIGYSDGSTIGVSFPDADPNATSFTFTPAGGGGGGAGVPVPEPDTAVMMGLGLAGLVLTARRTER